MHRKLERWLRKSAYYIIACKDKNVSVFKHRTDFLKFAFGNIDSIRRETLRKLRRIIKHAYHTVPYYHRVMKQLGFYPDDIKEPKDLKHLPYLTKDLIETHKQDMISQAYRGRRLIKSYTGGSSGTPTSFYQDRNCITTRTGRQLGILELCNYYVGDRSALIWGAHQDLASGGQGQSLKRKIRKFASGRETLCCNVMDPKKMMSFYNKLAAFQPEVFYGYPNAMTQFAQFIMNHGLRTFDCKSIICTAERLTEPQCDLLSEVFGGEVYNLYCTREHGCIGFECKEHKGFHIDTGSVHLETEPIDAHDSNSIGEIIITDLLNYGMPLIRNKIGDLGRLSERECSCGCSLPLLESLDGRVTDMLLRPDGSAVAGVMLVDLFLDVKEIRAMQVIQEEIDTINILLEVNEGYNETIEKKALKEIKGYMGDEMIINIRRVKKIPRNPSSGKFQEVICKVKPNIKPRDKRK